MKLVANLRLKPTPEQEHALRTTLERCNEACNWLSKRAFETKVFRQYDLHKACYAELRERFGLSAQVAVRCIAKVADAYKLDTKKQRTFRKHAAQPYDDRILRFCADDIVSLWLLDGRNKIVFVCGEHQRRLLEHRKGEVDLVFIPYEGTRPIRGRWFVTCVIDGDPEELVPSDTDLAYFAGLFDGEGCISMAEHTNGRIPRLIVQMAISHKPALIRLQQWFGGGIYEQKRYSNKPMFAWQIGSFEDQFRFLDAIQPFLDEKRTQADAALLYLAERKKYSDRSRLPEEINALAIKTSASLRKLKEPVFAHTCVPCAVESPSL